MNEWVWSGVSHHMIQFRLQTRTPSDPLGFYWLISQILQPLDCSTVKMLDVLIEAAKADQQKIRGGRKTKSKCALPQTDRRGWRREGNCLITEIVDSLHAVRWYKEANWRKRTKKLNAAEMNKIFESIVDKVQNGIETITVTEVLQVNLCFHIKILC